jgi:hypothetical protein
MVQAMIRRARGVGKRMARARRFGLGSGVALMDHVIGRRYDLAPFAVGNVGGETQFNVGLHEQVPGFLSVSAELVLVVVLRPLDQAHRLCDRFLRIAQIAVATPDVDARRLRDGTAGGGESAAECDDGKKILLAGHGEFLEK